MSTIGTGIAAAVANTGQAARTQAATQSGREAQRASSAEQTDKVTLTQLHDASATRDTDEDMPDGQAPGYEDAYGEDDAPNEEEQNNPNDQIHSQDAPPSSPTNLLGNQTYGPSGKEEITLFHALDIKA